MAELLLYRATQQKTAVGHQPISQLHNYKRLAYATICNTKLYIQSVKPRSAKRPPFSDRGRRPKTSTQTIQAMNTAVDPLRAPTSVLFYPRALRGIKKCWFTASGANGKAIDLNVKFWNGSTSRNQPKNRKSYIASPATNHNSLPVDLQAS